MNFKRYIGAFIIILTFFGALKQQRISIPNQEIVLQFSNLQVASIDAESTIEGLKKQLEALGVHSIQVKALSESKFKIAYYSDTDVARIKEIFAGKAVSIDYHLINEARNTSKLPSDKNSITYNLDIYEIQENPIEGWGFDGALASKIDSKSDRFIDPNWHSFTAHLTVRNTEGQSKIAYDYHKHVALTFDEVLYKIPEGRAGPYCI